MSGGRPPPASEQAVFFVHFGDDLGGDGMLLSMLMIPHEPLITSADAGSDSTYATPRAAA